MVIWEYALQVFLRPPPPPPPRLDPFHPLLHFAGEDGYIQIRPCLKSAIDKLLPNLSIIANFMGNYHLKTPLLSDLHMNEHDQ